MVFVMVAHIEGQPIEGTIIRVGLLTFLVHIVLGNKMACHGMDAHPWNQWKDRQVHQMPRLVTFDDSSISFSLTKDGANDHIEHRLEAPKVVDRGIKAQLGDDIDDFPLGGFLGVGEQGAKGVEARLNEEEKCLEVAATEGSSLP